MSDVETNNGVGSALPENGLNTPSTGIRRRMAYTLDAKAKTILTIQQYKEEGFKSKAIELAAAKYGFSVHTVRGWMRDSEKILEMSNILPSSTRKIHPGRKVLNPEAESILCENCNSLHFCYFDRSFDEFQLRSNCYSNSTVALMEPACPSVTPLINAYDFDASVKDIVHKE